MEPYGFLTKSGSNTEIVFTQIKHTKLKAEATHDELEDNNQSVEAEQGTFNPLSGS